MTFKLLTFPTIAILVGLLVYFGCSNDRPKQAQVGRCIFLCGFLLFLWIITFHGTPALLKW